MTNAYISKMQQKLNVVEHRFEANLRNTSLGTDLGNTLENTSVINESLNGKSMFKIHTCF